MQLRQREINKEVAIYAEWGKGMNTTHHFTKLNASNHTTCKMVGDLNFIDPSSHSCL